VLAHAHGDHVAGVGEPRPAPKPRGYGTVGRSPTRLVDDQDLIGSLIVFNTPGHTPGHIALLDPRSDALIAGDAVLTQGRVAVSGDLVLRWPFLPLNPRRSNTIMLSTPKHMATAGALMTVLLAASPGIASAAPAPVVAGGCRVQADAVLSPGLTLTSQPFTYHYKGTLNGCAYTGKGAPKGGSITAGEPITINGRRYQEPVPTGTGTCLGTATTGYDFARWADGTQTIVKFTTSSAGAGTTNLAGTIVPKLTLPAIGSSGPSTTFKTTRFIGQQAFGTLTFHASDPALCGSSGLTAARITGILGHVGDRP
jgi:hypothetical protein